MWSVSFRLVDCFSSFPTFVSVVSSARNHTHPPQRVHKPVFYLQAPVSAQRLLWMMASLILIVGQVIDQVSSPASLQRKKTIWVDRKSSCFTLTMPLGSKLGYPLFQAEGTVIFMIPLSSGPSHPPVPTVCFSRVRFVSYSVVPPAICQDRVKSAWRLLPLCQHTWTQTWKCLCFAELCFLNFFSERSKSWPLDFFSTLTHFAYFFF